MNIYRGGEVPFRYDERAGEVRTAVILGAQVLRGGRASRTLEARVRHGAELYQRGAVDLLIPTGGLGEHPPREAEIMAWLLRDAGVPESAILLEDRATNTWESALFVAEMERQESIGEIRAVTDPLHCPRTIRAFREAGLRAWAEPVYSSPMWRVPLMRRGQLAREMVASVWYRVRHGIGSRSTL
ncbi:MAG TPA: YdcF family protein [Rubrobacteraceae bacterium]|nr:YdcF family protein [Rubrobacteraceae bacterium]